MFVAFTDSSESVIAAVFSSVQDVGVWPHQGELDATDTRYANFYKAFPSAMQSGLPALEVAE